MFFPIANNSPKSARLEVCTLLDDHSGNYKVCFAHNDRIRCNARNDNSRSMAKNGKNADNITYYVWCFSFSVSFTCLFCFAFVLFFCFLLFQYFIYFFVNLTPNQSHRFFLLISCPWDEYEGYYIRMHLLDGPIAFEHQQERCYPILI